MSERSDGVLEFDGGILDFVRNPEYYAGIYNATPVVVLADETMLMVPADADVTHEPDIRSYLIDGCKSEDGNGASIRVEYHHRDEDEVTHVVGTTNLEGIGEERTLPAVRWGIEQMEGVNFDDN